MLRIDGETCAACMSCAHGKAKVSHYGVIFNHGRYRWFAVIECSGYCGIREVRECPIVPDDSEMLFLEIYGRTPDASESFRMEIERQHGRKIRKHCELSMDCGFYETHLLK